MGDLSRMSLVRPAFVEADRSQSLDSDSCPQGGREDSPAYNGSDSEGGGEGGRDGEEESHHW